MSVSARKSRFASIGFLGAGVAALFLGVGMTILIERYVSQDRVLEARTQALLWTLRVRLVAVGVASLLAGAACRSAAIREGFRRFNHRRSSSAVLCLLLALYAAVGLYIDPYLVSDLRPTPDATEYAVSARQLMSDGLYRISFGQTAYPPRYAFGFPLLLIPFYWMFGAEPSNAVLCPLLLVSLTAALTYRTGERLWGRGAGIAAGLLTLSSPAVINAGRSITSESAAALAIALAAWLVLRLVEQERAPWAWAALGFVVGAGAIVRLPNVLLLVPVGLVVLTSPRPHPRASILACACAGAACAAALAPVLVYNAKAFGSAMRTGYSFWVPYYFDVPGNAFRLSYALQRPAMGDSPELPNALFYGGTLSGWNRACYAVPAAAFILLGALRALRGSRATRRFAIFVLSSAALLVVFHTFYFFSGTRFISPLCPILMVLAGVGVVSCADLRLAGWKRGRTLPFNLLCVWLILEAVAGVGAGYASSMPRKHEIATLIGRRTEPDAVVITGIDPLFFQTASAREAMPVSRRVEYASKIILPRPIGDAVPDSAASDPVRYQSWALSRGARRPVEFVAAESPERIAAYLAQGRPVYCEDFDLRGEDVELRRRFEYVPVDSVAGVRLYRLRLP